MVVVISPAYGMLASLQRGQRSSFRKIEMRGHLHKSGDCMIFPLGGTDLYVFLMLGVTPNKKGNCVLVAWGSINILDIWFSV